MQNYIILGGVYYQQVPPPHNVVVSRSSIPTPSLVPVPVPVVANSPRTPSPIVPTMVPVTSSAPSVVPSEVPLPTTDTEADDKETEATKDGITAAADAVFNSVQDAQQGKDITPSSVAPSQGSVDDKRQSRPRSRSSSSRQSHQPSEMMTKPAGVAPNDTSAKKIRGIGRGKTKNSGLPVTPTTPLGNITYSARESADYNPRR